ncbi:MAG: hypothetical protein DHS20C20_17240 [Ardenticatenaceae bacterium]|nr:MAG: hypothetical protein DHS20C20_17240 [Ardenticatenaceae bacterium]
MKQKVSAKNVPHSALHIWFLSLIVLSLFGLALATAVRLPHFLATGDVVRLVGTVIFNLVALAGLIDNAYTHIIFWRNQNRQVAKQPEIATQS